MIAPPVPAALAPYRRAYAESPLPHVEVPDALSPALVAHVRAHLSEPLFEPFDFPPRGRYDRSTEPPAPELTAALAGVASSLAGAPLAVLGATWIRARHRSYSLLRDDEPLPAAVAELVLDLSDRATGEGQLLYTHRGQPYFVATQAPGSLALVARGPTVRRYLRYVTHRAGDAVLLRLVLPLGPG